MTTAVRVSQDGNVTMVQCNSTHLTSFAVLSMNVTGTRIVSSCMTYAVSYLLEPLMYDERRVRSKLRTVKLGRDHQSSANFGCCS